MYTATRTTSYIRTHHDGSLNSLMWNTFPGINVGTGQTSLISSHVLTLTCLLSWSPLCFQRWARITVVAAPRNDVIGFCFNLPSSSRQFGFSNTVWTKLSCWSSSSFCTEAERQRGARPRYSILYCHIEQEKEVKGVHLTHRCSTN